MLVKQRLQVRSAESPLTASKPTTWLRYPLDRLQGNGLCQADEGFDAEQATVQTACFVAGTPVRLRYGCKPIEQLQKGDRVLSRDQYNPSAPVVEQVVEETFMRTAPVLRLTDRRP